jgi:hypothetical protein
MVRWYAAAMVMEPGLGPRGDVVTSIIGDLSSDARAHEQAGIHSINSIAAPTARYTKRSWSY